MLEAVWLIPALPLAGFLVLLATGRRLGDPAAGWLATAAIAGSFLATLFLTDDALDGIAIGQRAFSGALDGSGENIEKLGEALFTRYLFAFEITSVLLVIAIVGAVVLARAPRATAAQLEEQR